MKSIDEKEIEKELKSESEHKHFSSDEIQAEEQQFIDTYVHNTKNYAIGLLLKLYRVHFGKILVSVLFYILQVTPAWIIPIVTSNIINIAVERPENSLHLFLVNIGVAVCAIALNPFFFTMHRRFFSRANRSVEAGLRGAMVRKLQQLSISFHKSMTTGRIQSKVMRDVEAVGELSSQVFGNCLEVFVNVFVIITIIVTKNFLVFGIFLITAPSAILATWFFRRKLRIQNHLFRKEYENTSSDVLDMVSLVPITRAHALENKEIRKITDRVTHVAEKGYKLDVTSSMFGSINWAVISFFQIACLTTSTILAINGKITIGDISLYQSYFNMIVNKVSTLIALIPIIAKGTESINSIGEILASYDVEDFSGKEKVTSVEGDYVFENVSFHYDDDERTVLSDLNLHIKKGETIAFVGESGAGKSTIVNMAIGFYKPNTGKVYIDGRDMNTIDLRSYRKHLAVVPQNTVLFNGTIRDNITYGMPDVSEEKLRQVCDAANLSAVIDKLPHGLDTEIGEDGSKLSGGQRQRISIARAIIRNPDVIIFDEATSALDTISEAEIQEAINTLTKDRTTFIVAHRLSTIRGADKIAVMSDGRCVEFGSYDELMEKKGAFYAYRMTQT